MANGFNIDAFKRGLATGGERFRSAVKEAVDVLGEQVIGDAQQLTPVDTGALQASGTTEPAVVDADGVHKTLGFNTSYAAAVHENLEAHHPVGQAKFLSSAMEATAPKAAAFVGTRVKAAGF